MRNGVAPHISGSRSGAASMSATVVVPVRSNIRTPANQDSANSEKLQPDLAVVMSLIQSVNYFCGGIVPDIRV